MQSREPKVFLQPGDRVEVALGDFGVLENPVGPFVAMDRTPASMRWGILGAARINRSIIPALRAAEGHTLEAIASRDADKAAAAAAEWEIPRSVDGYDALLADPDVDAVYIPLPNHLHAEWTVRAAEAGKHVLCEKPLALTLDEVDRIAAAAAAAHVHVAEALHVPAPPADLRGAASWSPAGPSARCGSSAAASASRSIAPATSASTRPMAAARSGTSAAIR